MTDYKTTVNFPPQQEETVRAVQRRFGFRTFTQALLYIIQSYADSRNPRPAPERATCELD